MPSNDHSRSNNRTINLHGEIPNNGILEEEPEDIENVDIDLSNELNSLFNCSMPLNDHAATTIDHGLNTGLFLYKLNGLFDDLDTSIENQQHFCENDSVNSSVSGFSTEEANFLHIIDVDAILESDAQDVKSPSIRSCTDLDKPRDTKDLPGNSGLFGDESSSSEDSDDDLGFGLFDDDSDLAPATVKHQLQDSQCRGEQTSTNSIKATNTDSPDEDSEDDLDLHLFSDDEDSAVSKTVKPKSVNTTYQKQQPFHNTKSKTTNTDPVKKTVITCARVSEKDNTNFDAWFETMMGASESREFVKRSESEIDWCVICMDKFNNPRILHKCSHQFCSDCITDYFKVRPQCPVCFVVYGVIEGNQPRDGTMTHSINNRLKLPGYEKHKTIIVYYDFPDGVQTVRTLYNMIRWCNKISEEFWARATLSCSFVAS